MGVKWVYRTTISNTLDHDCWVEAVKCLSKIITVGFCPYSTSRISNQNNLYLNHMFISDIMRSETFRLIISISKWNKERKVGWRMDVDIDDTDSELESGVTDEEN